MPMFLNEDEARERVERKDNFLNSPTINIIERCGSGRRIGDKGKSDDLRESIGVFAAIFGPSIAAKTFDCSVYEAHALAKGKIKGSDGELPEKISDKLKPIRDAALDKTLEAINFIDQEKLANEKANVLASIAQNLSKVAQNVTPQLNQQQNNVQFNFYAPRLKEEDDFDVIEVSN